jgi:hypothetical protein
MKTSGLIERSIMVLCTLLCIAPSALADGRMEWVVPSGQDEAIKGLLGSYGENKELEGGYRFSKISPQSKSIAYGLTKADADAGSILVLHISRAKQGDLRGMELAIRVQALNSDPLALQHLENAAKEMQSNDSGSIFIGIEVDAQPTHLEPPPPPEPNISDGLRQSLIALALACLWLLIAAWRSKPMQLSLNIKRTHVLPMTLQFILFLYWSVYWVETANHMAFVGAQLLFAYLVEGALNLSRQGKWAVGLGPFPIVFSINLFVWYQGTQTWCAFAVIALALLSKAYLRRGGRHIFNPSALGITVLGLLYMAEFAQVGWTNTTVFTFVDVSHPLTAAPNMTELILLLALIPQSRFPIVMLSISALTVMVLFGDSFGGANPLAIVPHDPLHPLWPPVFLAITLLATDPATIPKTQNGKILFGLCLGLMITLGSAAMNGSGGDDYFTKVLPIPILNLLIHRLDDWGTRIPQALSRPFEARFNKMHMVLFVVLTAVGLVTTEVKEGALNNAHFYQEDYVRRLDLSNRDDRCVNNKAWCTPFSFVDEAKSWLD